jgi:hypothetical protein
MDIRRDENSVPGANVLLFYVMMYKRSKIMKKSIHQWKKILYVRCEHSTVLLCKEKKEKKNGYTKVENAMSDVNVVLALHYVTM